MAHSHGSDSHGHGVGHVVGPGILIANGVALLILTIITVAAARVDLGQANLVVAIAIAVVKASLVCLIFMHLYWDKPFNGLILVSSLAFAALFLTLALYDTVEYHPAVINQAAAFYSQGAPTP
ncbi:MAG: cytochrome C oxidase subunit IV family protein [Phycisphaerales bacterium]|nr:cytochrome C oxidase subunit IV family protein [Phycisphaerales bacterium]